MLTQQSIDGLELFSYSADFPADQPPILFIHGAFISGWMWTETFMPYLAAKGHPCYALSLRCHGGSQASAHIDQLSIGDYVADVEKIVDWLAKTEECDPVLVGHSMGGFIIQKYLEKHAARAAALLCSVPPQGLMTSQISLMMQKPQFFADINTIMSGQSKDANLLREALFASDVDAAQINRWLIHMQPESHRAIWDMSVFDLPQPNRMYRPPLLIVGTEKDAIVPSFVVRAAGQVYDVPVQIFEGMGHAITHEKNWQQVADFLHDWLVEIEI